MVTQRAAPDTAWRLFVDWCTATGARPLPASVVTIGAFFEQVPAAEATLRARLRAIRRAHQAAGQQLRVGYEPSPTAWRTGPGWLTLPAALARCPVGGWPGGVHGRRDAFLLTVLATTRLTRSQAVRLSVDDIGWGPAAGAPQHVTVAGVPLEPAPDPAECPACAVTRWLRVLALEHRWGRASVRQMLMLAPMRPRGHDCADAAPERWREVWQLAPAVDQHGGFTDWRPMSTRAVSAVLAHRLADRAAPAPPPVEEAEPAEWDDWQAPPHSPLAGVAEDDLWALLEEKVAAAQSTNARIDALLADTESFLGSLSDPSQASDEPGWE